MGVFSSLLSNLWVMRAVAAEEPKDELGLFFAFTTFLSYLMLLQAGMDFAVSQRVAEALVNGDEASARRVYRQLVWYNRGLAGVVVMAVVAVILTLQWGRLTDASNTVLAQRLTAVSGLFMALSALTLPSSAAIAGVQSLHAVHLTRVASNFAVVLLAYVFLQLGAGVLCLPAAQAVAQGGTLGVLSYLRRKYCPWADGPVVDPWAGFRRLFRYASTVGGVGVLNTIEFGCEPVVITAVLGDPLPVLAAYSLWLRFPGIAFGVGGGVIVNASPTLASAFTADRSRGVVLYRKLFWAAALIALAAAAGVGLWLTPFVHHWLGGAYDQPDGPLISTLLAAFASLRIVSVTMSQLLYTLGEGRLVLYTAATIAGCKVALGLLLTPLWPTFGLVVAWVAGILVSCVWLAVVLHRRRILPVQWAAAAVLAVVVVLAVANRVAGWTAGFDLVPLGIGISGTLLVFGLGAAAVVGRIRKLQTSPTVENMPTVIE
jgi:O-antigen/teichoic acid export membrane protein